MYIVNKENRISMRDLENSKRGKGLVTHTVATQAINGHNSGSTGQLTADSHKNTLS